MTTDKEETLILSYGLKYRKDKEGNVKNTGNGIKYMNVAHVERERERETFKYSPVNPCRALNLLELSRAGTFA